MTGADFEAVASLLSAGRRFLLTGHRNPDGDSLGSALALAQALQDRGKEALVVMRDRWSSSYEGMPGVSDVRVSADLPPDWPAGWDAALVMECPEPERPGFPALLSGTTVNVDHHPGNTRWATHNLVVLPAAAVGEIIADLLDRLEWPMTPRIATNLWVSLVSDTGSFRYGNTTARALALGARLVTEGVRPDVVNEFLYEARPLSTVKLESLVLGTLELHDEGRVALVSLPKRFLAESGADEADGEGLVNQRPGNRRGEGRRPRPRKRRAGGLPLLASFEGVRRRPLRRVGTARRRPPQRRRLPRLGDLGDRPRPTSPTRSPPR